ncbi:hypothetical protein XCV2733 [Xanthomonas euvesicatoria pv. vesicatoria str. 85-10]|uniref:Uncharacterized protein n=1 Tax=Xanthomonas euvesicatoria pv. vesicatoria (strain 85-10) TaxID=316273 RepID=Q3BRZ9_XANE5|nr:hypothetical protein XCV2733 [Xanthomonas euvesicatoria pv. vesicatoria str. 85-10]
MQRGTACDGLQYEARTHRLVGHRPMARNGKRLQQDQHRLPAPQILRQRAVWPRGLRRWRPGASRAPARTTAGFTAWA